MLYRTDSPDILMNHLWLAICYVSGRINCLSSE